MNGLSIEEKAQRYDEAIELAKDSYNYPSYPGFIRADVVFPELKESEKWIPKEIIEYLKEKGDFRSCWISWLEDHKYTEEDLDKAYKCADEVQYRKGFEDAKKEVEGKGEQKPTNTVEPRFHVGDWIIFAEYHNSIYQVEGMDIYCYYLRHYLGGSFLVHFDNVLIRLWTIEDAKDGDVLATKDAIFIYKHKDKAGLSLCRSYCEVIGESKLGLGRDFSIHDVHPATKDQRDLLFQKIKEAGYEWDAGKKELNKIEENPAWSEEDRDYFDAIITKLEMTQDDALLTDNQMEFLKSLKDRIQPQQEWSEDDENEYNNILKILNSVAEEQETKGYNNLISSINWFNSLKGRIQPKQEFIEEDDDDAWLNDIVSKLESGCQLNKSEISWFKSIKNRIQAKQEWSEKDEEMLKWLCRIVHSQMVGKVITLKEESELGEWMDKWLNHNPQPHWKPTDEQMHYLYWIANVKLGDSVVEQELSKHLNELHQDLKKLKGE